MKLLKYIFVLSCLFTHSCRKKEKEVNSLIMGKIILIDPGHGGKDNGASYDNVLEDEINLKIGLILYKKLLENGCFSLITRNADYDLSSMYDSNHKVKDLNNRIKMINDNMVDLFISLHLNSYSSSNVTGAQVFYQNNEESKKFASILQKEMNKLYLKQRKEKNGDFYILNKSKRNGVLVEMGFLSSPLDREKLLNIEYQNKIANTIYNSIKIYFDE